MKSNDLSNLDCFEPNEGHEIRFLKKLENHKKVSKNKFNLKIKFVTVAASISIFIGFISFYFYNNLKNDEKIFSPEMYYANQVKMKIIELKSLKNSLTKPIIDDVVKEISKLEKDYLKLEKERKNTGLNEQLLNAMIINMQTRLDLLKRVQVQILQLQTITNTQNHENHI